MSAMSRATTFAGLAASALCAASAAAAPQGSPPAPAGPVPMPAAPAAAPKPAPRAKKAPAKPPEPELPPPDVRLTVVAPSAQGSWTMRIENEGTRWVRVPADVRLLRLTIESGDTMSKKRDKPVSCQVPASMRPDAFPEPRALLLGPGEAYVETFDPRLFCFGKDAHAVAGGAIVRARFGWEAPRGAKKVDAPFAAQATDFPAAVAPQKQLFAPTIVLSYQPPDPDAAPATPPEAAKADKDDDAADAKAKVDKDDKDDKDDKPKDDKPPAPPDENAPRLELSATPFADAANGFHLAMTVTITNVGHRAALAAIRPRMLGFRVDGPDGIERCGAVGQTRAIPREGYSTLKPGGKKTLTVLVEEACGRPFFRRPGLYKVTPSLHLAETGAERGLTAYTGVARAREPTLVRIAEGPLPFHAHAPRTVKVEKPDLGDGPTP